MLIFDEFFSLSLVFDVSAQAKRPYAMTELDWYSDENAIIECSTKSSSVLANCTDIRSFFQP